MGDEQEDQRRAEIFDALGHPTRIIIIKALSEETLGFADLKKRWESTVADIFSTT